MNKLPERLMEKNPSKKGDNLMFTVTDKASEAIKEFLKEKNENSAIRITMAMSCCGPALGMSLGEQTSDDEEFNEIGQQVLEKYNTDELSGYYWMGVIYLTNKQQSN
jgi:hypothetical protein